MKRTLIAAATVCISGAPMAVAYADGTGSYTATLDGQTIGQGTNVSCKPFSSYGSDGGAGVKIVVGRGANGNQGVETSFWGDANIGTDGPEVYQVSLHPLANANSSSPGYLAWAAGPNKPQSQATVVKSDDTYRITGTVAPVYQPGVSPASFEFEVTCP